MWYAALAATLVLNEVLYDPAGTDAGREFVELYNPTGDPVALAGLEIEVGDGAHPGVWRRAWRGTSGAVAPDGLFVVGGDSVAADARLEIDLQNGPDAIRLRRDLEIQDRLGYGDLVAAEFFETRPAPDVAGRSLARSPDGRDTDDNAADFVAATPSPGRRNRPRRNLALVLVAPDPTTAWPGRALRARVTVRNLGLDRVEAGSWNLTAQLARARADTLLPDGAAWPVASRDAAAALAPGDSLHTDIEWVGDAGVFRLRVATTPADEDTTDDRITAWVRVGAGAVVVNEILFAPVPGAPEWIELWNRDDRAHDLRGWTLADASGRRARLSPPGGIPAGGFAVVAADTQVAIDMAPAVLRFAASPWNALNNSDGPNGFADALVLRDAAGVVVDAARYAAAGVERGRSLERLVADPGPAGVLWAQSKDRAGATPGRQNSATAPPSRGVSVQLGPNPFSPDGDGHDDLLVATLEVPEGCVGFRARLFDLDGRCRARLAADRLGPGPRTLSWDGRDEGGGNVAAGFYILHLEFDAKSGPPLRVRRVIGVARP